MRPSDAIFGISRQQLISFAIVLATLVGGLFFLRARSTDENVLRICTWSNYFTDSVMRDFQSKTGIRVELSFFSSNEELLAKLKAGATGFDIVQPSDYMVRRMIQLSMLETLDHSQLSNIGHVDDRFKNAGYDPGLRYSVPFTWGTTGIAVNTKKIAVPENAGWDLIFNSPDPRHTSLLDDMREVFAALLKWKNYSINQIDLNVLKKSKDTLSAMKGRILTFTSEPKPLLLREEVFISHIYSSDAVQARAENSDMQYFIPKEGATLYTDNWVIPKSSHHKRQAHRFLNYLLDPDIALPFFRQNRLASPNKTVKERLTPEELNDAAMYPSPDVMKRLEVMEDIENSLPEMNRLWTELKS